MATVLLQNIDKVYPNGFKAIQELTLSIAQGEFMVLVGPSGCAKSTTLRMIAGLEEVTGGDILIDGKRVNDLPPKDRGIAMVFQNYALYPHMSAYENIAFSLKQQKFSRSAIEGRVQEAARTLDIMHLLKNKPGEMSGGQRQRVALGRAMVRKPDVFLFDEPLSNLDAKLRGSTRVQIARLHAELKKEGQHATMIYVTHDQVEAMTLGDRICVLDKGQVMQVDTPMNLYNAPANTFVAGFIGAPAMNLLQGYLETVQGKICVVFEDGARLPLPENKVARIGNTAERSVVFGIRPEHIRFVPESQAVPAEGCRTGTVSAVELMGSEQYVYTSCGADSLTARVPLTSSKTVDVQENIRLLFTMQECHLFDSTTGQTLL